MTAFATQSNIDMSGPGLLGSDVVGSSRRKSKRITIGTGLTLSGGALSNSLDLSGYVQKTSATGSLILPSGTTAQRDGSPDAGYSRWNTTTSRFERWTGSAWENYVRLSGDTLTGDLSVGTNSLTAGLLTVSKANGKSLRVLSNGTEIFSVSPPLLGGSYYDRTHIRSSRFCYWSADSAGSFILFGEDASAPSTGAVSISGAAGGGLGLGASASVRWVSNSSISAGSPDAGFVLAANNVIAQRNGINAQCHLFNKSYTSDSSQEALMLDAGKQVSGKLGLYSYRGSSGGSNYPIQIGTLAADGTTFSGLTVGTDGSITVLGSGLTKGYIRATNPFSVEGASTGYPVELASAGTTTGIRIRNSSYVVEIAPAGSSSVVGFYTGAVFGASTTLASISCAEIIASGIVYVSASTTARASINLPSGTAPTSPANGDIWSDGSDIKVRLGGVTYTLLKV